MSSLSQRDFLYALGVAGAMLGACPDAEPVPASVAIKPISGIWFELQHHATVERGRLEP